MKYGIWRHENALGNSAEHTVGLCKHLMRIGDSDPTIYVEKGFQKDFAMCIPGVSPKKIVFFKDGICKAMMDRTIINDPSYRDIHMPSAYEYPGLKTYPAVWADLSSPPDCTLCFPEEYYEDKYKLPVDAIVIQVREVNTFFKRHEGKRFDSHRFVNPQMYFKVAEYFADKGYEIVRIGDRNQTPFPKHKNILDFALVKNRTMLDDLYLISKCKVFLSCDSGIWPIAGGMKKNLILSNLTSIFGPCRPQLRINNNGEISFRLVKTAIIDWLPKGTTKILIKKVRFASRADTFKNALKLLRYKIPLSSGRTPPYRMLPFDDIRSYGFSEYFHNKSMGYIAEIVDNSFEELIEAVQSFL